jgi:ribokinase
MFSKVDQKKLLFNPSTVYCYLGLKKITPLLEKTFVLFVNDAEIKMLTGKKPKGGSKELLDLGPEIVVCTMGDKGALITNRDSQFISPAKKVSRVIDTTGAGDTFAAGFIYGLIKNKSLEWSASLGNKMAAKALSDFGQHWMKSS